MSELNPYEAPQTNLQTTTDSSPQEMTPGRSAESMAYFCQVLTAVMWVVSANISGFTAYSSVFSAVFVLMTLGMIIYAIRIYSRNLLVIEICVLMLTILAFLVLAIHKAFEQLNFN